MPNRCTRCGKIYPDDADLRNGCSVCGGKFFIHVKEEQLKDTDEFIQLTKKQIDEIESDVRDIVGEENIRSDESVVLDLEAIRVIKPGKYEIDLTNLFTQRPIVIRIAPGKYEIDLTSIQKCPEEKEK
ncbi:MAG: hypothetical protein DRO96_02230 [Candidatus Aenigmatarchaeota archaeon]|nr:MAG: hypothetical protein B6U68_00795 [Candidatus Aenigmarchaeota archaeon ex4484_14]RLI96838.1 MAG: hypothetical protein DRO96_02230 [Candidatus Aenigmarchaeota archaeon]